ncbi:hypothetical protein [Caulobacter sp. BE254]|uniref:hypothetical protein n=1 Tax=Caulobacter sp. BE254 TaxID=2817720 RepID=UPI002867535A|nr:hypothetical protein [Caulobacter sp. BE254]MDR7118485.1 hypothetical protein [Caulobacter sp. BE254]
MAAEHSTCISQRLESPEDHFLNYVNDRYIYNPKYEYFILNNIMETDGIGYIVDRFDGNYLTIEKWSNHGDRIASFIMAMRARQNGREHEVEKFLRVAIRPDESEGKAAQRLGIDRHGLAIAHMWLGEILYSKRGKKFHREADQHMTVAARAGIKRACRNLNLKVIPDGCPEYPAPSMVEGKL